MSSIYGSTITYSYEVVMRKLQQLRFRGVHFSSLTNHNDDLKYASEAVYLTEEKLIVTFNGNIYNNQQLVDKYFSRSSDSFSDAELLGKLYTKKGKECIQELNGDFAFVIYDEEKRQFFGAVDRLGIKPLFYHHEANGLEWCSQLLPLCIGNAFEIDGKARQLYFALQYVPSPYSMVKQIRKLGPGEYFVFDVAGDSMNITQYWDLYSNSFGFQPPKSYNEALDACRCLINEAVVMRIDDSKKQGVFLSGGIDSTTIAKYAVSHNNFEGFTVGYEESAFDESDYAIKVSERYGIHINHLRCSSAEAVRIIQGLQQYYDEPMGDYSAIPTSLLCEKAGQSVEIALGGDGGDEVFFGYPRYLRYAAREKVYKTPLPIRRFMAAVVRPMGKKRMADSLLLNDVQQLYLNRRPSNDAELFNAYDVQQSILQTKYLYQNKDIRRAFNDFDIKTLMCFAYNVKLGRAAERGGLDVRTPFLDYRLVEYSRLLPIDYCYNEDVGQKRLLKEILKDDFDRSFFERKKQGFDVPLCFWFRKGLKDYLCDTLNEQALTHLPDYDANSLINIRNRHIAGEENQTTLLWLCVNYLEWYKLFQNCSK